MIEFKDKRTVKFHDFQKRNENHGEDLVPAIDIGITIKGPASELAMIHKDLPAALFRAGERPEESEGLDLAIDDLAYVRVPSLGMPIKLDHEQIGMTLHIDYGLSGTGSDIVLALVKLSKVRVTEILEGGFAIWRLMLSCSCEINEQIIGKVAMLEGYEITIVLTAPVVQEPERPLTEEDVFGPAPTETIGSASEFAKSVEDAFVNESKPAAPKGKGRKAKTA